MHTHTHLLAYQKLRDLPLVCVASKLIAMAMASFTQARPSSLVLIFSFVCFLGKVRCVWRSNIDSVYLDTACMRVCACLRGILCLHYLVRLAENDGVTVRCWSELIGTPVVFVRRPPCASFIDTTWNCSFAVVRNRHARADGGLLDLLFWFDVKAIY